MELTPAQQEVLDQLRAIGHERPEVDAGYRHELRTRVERALAAVAGGLLQPVFVNKAALVRVLSCEAHQVAEAAVPFEWSIPAARGTVAHKAIQLSVLRHDVPAPLLLVDDALDRLGDDPSASIADFLLGLSPTERAELRGDVNEVVAGFLELWPPLQPQWKPQTETRRRAELCGGMVILSGTVDLTIGAPQGLRAGRVVIDLKTGRAQAHHADDLRFYALLDTLRVGVPPFSLLTYYLESGQFSPEQVTEDTLEAAVRRVVAGTTKLIELQLGARSPQLSPNPACRWCCARTSCEGARTWADTDRELDPA